MAVPPLWLSFLDGADGRPAPRLHVGADPRSPAIELSDRARWVLAAISLPRELAPETASDERQRARLGSRLWSSGEITARIPYQHRSTIRHALGDLRARLGEDGLALDDYLLIDTSHGRYGVRPGRITIDLVELHEARHDPDALDRRLDVAVAERRRARLAPVCAHLLAEPVLRELERAIAASAARAPAQASPDPAARAPQQATASPAEDSPQQATASPAEDSPGQTSPDPAAHAPAADLEPGPPRAASEHAGAPAGAASAPTPPGLPSRRTVWLPALAVILIAAIVTVVVLGGDGRARTTIHAYGPPRVEVSGGLAHTWSNPLTAGGRQGPEIFGGERVTIACRTHGFVVQDGNKWWYLIDSRPWSRHYFVTADAFYNNGRTSGSLRGSAFVDPRVARCSPLPRSLR